MKRHLKSIAGVTLLEIMLVLAIASMVIVMSIRYYQNATNAENANIILEEIQNITAAADNLSQGSGTFSSVNTTNVGSIAGSKNMITPYGAASTFTITSGAGSYTVSVGTMPASVCSALFTKLTINSKFSGAGCSAGVLSYTYSSTS
jgi:type II secretory pathway pseudopilin PulG